MRGKLIWLFLLFLGLISIRAFQEILFYDPLITYYKNDYLYTSFPDLSFGKLYLSYSFRFFLNSVLSFLILQVTFSKKRYWLQVMPVFGIAYIFLMITFFILVSGVVEVGYILPFYIRRFIIHPVLILLFLPWYYFQEKLDR